MITSEGSEEGKIVAAQRRVEDNSVSMLLVGTGLRNEVQQVVGIVD